MIGPIFMAADGGYAMPLATALRSLAEANRAHWPIDVVLLATEFPLALREKVMASLPAGSTRLDWREADLGCFARAQGMTSASRINYARILIGDLLAERTGRVLYLDSDILVLDDLAALFCADLGGRALGAVADDLDLALKSNGPGLDGVPRVARYFNSGVLLFDLARWREECFARRALAYLDRHPDTPFSDQDALNVACDGQWAPLDGRWNHIEFYRWARIADLRHPPGILHFAAWHKPWNFRHPTPNAALYDAYRKKTRFARTSRQRLIDAGSSGWFHLKRALRGLVPGRPAAGAFEG